MAAGILSRMEERRGIRAWRWYAILDPLSRHLINWIEQALLHRRTSSLISLVQRLDQNLIGCNHNLHRLHCCVG